MHEPVLRRWGATPYELVIVGAGAVAMIVAAITVEAAIALGLIPLGLLLSYTLWFDIRITEDELIVRYPFSPTRIPRSAIDHAEFEYVFPGTSQLWIHLRDGSVTRVGMVPRASSSELSGDPAQPGSAAYEITAWARN
jgi:hypothetical protein